MNTKSVSNKITSIIDSYVLPFFFVVIIFVLITVLMVQIPPFTIYKSTLVQNYTDLVYGILSIILAILNFGLHPFQLSKNISNLILVIVKLLTYLGGSVESIIKGIFQLVGIILTDLYNLIPGQNSNVISFNSCTQADILKGAKSCTAIFDPSNTNNFNLGKNALSGNLAGSKFIAINQYDLSTLTYSLGIYVDVTIAGETVSVSAVFQISLLGTGNIGPFGILLVGKSTLPYLHLPVTKIGISLIDFILKPFKDYSAQLGSWKDIFQKLQAV